MVPLLRYEGPDSSTDEQGSRQNQLLQYADFVSFMNKVSDFYIRVYLIKVVIFYR